MISFGKLWKENLIIQFSFHENNLDQYYNNHALAVVINFFVSSPRVEFGYSVTLRINSDNNNSQIVPAYVGCGEFLMYTILPLCVKDT